MLTVNELFAGIGSQRAALERLGIEHKVVGIAEIDKFAIKSYEAIWGDTKNYGDISKVEKLDYADFWTYSFPCQDISVAGKQAGINKHTRSGLLYEVERLLEKSKECGELPKYLMLENVKNLVGKKFKPQFEEWIVRLDELGFNTKWQVLNAKNYGIPQNRERVFAISIRKDIDMGYEFPEPFELKIRLKDVLEKEVDEKFYLSDMVQQRLKITDKTFTKSVIGTTKPDFRTIGQRDLVYQQDSIMGALVATDYKQPKQILIPQATKQGYIECNVPGVADLSFPDSKTRRGRVQESGEIVPTLMAGQQDICYMEPVIAASRGRNPNNPSDRTPGSPTEQRLEVNQKGTSNTITTVQKDNYVIEPSNLKHTELPCIYDDRDKGFGIKTSDVCPTQRAERYGIKCIETDYRIRKLTPKECWRLMGFTDEQFYRAAYGHDIPAEYVEKLHNRTLTKKEYRAYHRLTRKQEVSNSQLYKQAGNSIVVDVLYYIFRNLFIEKPEHRVCVDNTEQLKGQMNLLDYL